MEPVKSRRRCLWTAAAEPSSLRDRDGMDDIDIDIGIAGRSGKVFTRADALAAGLTHRQIDGRIRRGEVQVLRPGVYVDSGEEVDVVMLATAALAKLGQDAVVSHQTAALIHGIALLGPRLAAVDVTRPANDDRTPDTYPDLRSLRAALPADHVVEIGGLRVTSPARTVFDVARTSSFRSGVVSVDSALHAGIVTSGSILAVADDCRRWPGKRRAIDAAQFGDPLCESVTESVSRVVIRDGGLPAPRTQVVLGDDDGVIGRVDFFWEEGVVGEADGRVKYTGDDLSPLWAEKLRQERMENAGFIVVRWTWGELFNDPDRVVRRIRRALERAAARRSA